MTGEALDAAMEGDEEEAETDAIVAQVLDEIGIDINQSLADAPSGRLGVARATRAGGAGERHAVAEGGGGGGGPSGGAGASGSGSGAAGGGDDDAALQARLDSLRKG